MKYELFKSTMFGLISFGQSRGWLTEAEAIGIQAILYRKSWARPSVRVFIRDCQIAHGNAVLRKGRCSPSVPESTTDVHDAY